MKNSYFYYFSICSILNFVEPECHSYSHRSEYNNTQYTIKQWNWKLFNDFQKMSLIHSPRWIHCIVRIFYKSICCCPNMVFDYFRCKTNSSRSVEIFFWGNFFLSQKNSIRNIFQFVVKSFLFVFKTHLILIYKLIEVIMVKKPIEMAGTMKLNCSMVYFIVEIRKCNYLKLRSQISPD